MGLSEGAQGITASMSRRSNCRDTCSETLFGSLKVERLHRQHGIEFCKYFHIPEYFPPRDPPPEY